MMMIKLCLYFEDSKYFDLFIVLYGINHNII